MIDSKLLDDGSIEQYQDILGVGGFSRKEGFNLIEVLFSIVIGFEVYSR
jgi:hypothetical protein